MTDTPPYYSLLPRVQELFREAIPLSCGEDVCHMIDDYPVTIANSWKSNGDFQCFVAAAIFSRTIGMQNKLLASTRQKQDDGQDGEEQNKMKSRRKRKKAVGVMKVRTVSKFGLVRDREYRSSREVAEGIVSCFEYCNETTLELIADVRISGKSGCIMITTKSHMSWHISEDRLPCSVCGKFCKSARGLRYHQVLEHNIQYFDAQKTALTSEMQVILYSANHKTVTHFENTVTETKKDEVRARDCLGDDGLEYARAGNVEALKCMVTSGWNPHVACDKHGNTSLMWAAGEGHLNMCKYLVDNCGVNVHEKKGGKYKKIRHALHWAARNGHIPICDWLINEKNVDVNIEADDGTVPLHFAVWTNNFEMVKWLVEKACCDLHKLNSYGCNASQWGALNGDVEMLILLQSYGLNLGILNLNGHSAIHKAAVNGRLKACQWLLTPRESEVEASQQNIDKSNYDNHTSLPSGGGGLNMKFHMQADRSGNTPAMIALNNGHDDTANWLNQHCSLRNIANGNAKQCVTEECSISAWCEKPVIDSALPCKIQGENSEVVTDTSDELD